MPFIADSSVATQQEIREVVLGPKVLTVGPGARFATIGDAVDYIVANASAPTEVYAGVFGGTVATTQYSDVLTFSGMTAPFNGFAAARSLSISEPVWIKIEDETAYRSIQRVLTGTSLVMHAGFNLAGVTGKTYGLYTMDNWVIDLLPGDHELTGQHDLGTIRANVAVRGQGINVSRIIGGAAGFTTVSLNFPLSGSFSISNCSFIKSNVAITMGTVPSINTWQEESTGLLFDMYNFRGETQEAGSQSDILNASVARCRMYSVDIGGKDNIFIVYADDLSVQNVSIDTNTGSASTLALNCMAWQCTKKAFISGVIGTARGTGTEEILTFNKNLSNGITKEYYVTNVVTPQAILALNNSGNTVGDLVVYMHNCVCKEVISNKATIYANNVKQGNLTAITATLLNTGVINT